MAEYVDPINSKSFYDYNVALNEAGRKSAQAEIDAAKAKGVDLLNPEGGVLNDTTGNAIRLRSMLQGIANSDDQAGAATFYGLTLENYQNALSGDPTRPMGGNQAVYGSQLLSPLEQRAAEAARGQGISTMSPETAALAKANPDVFNAASQRFQNYLATTYPGTLEYESVLSGPMQFSNAGVKYPKIDDTASMYILDPRTNQIIKNPNYRGPKKAADGGLMSLTDSPRQSGLHQFAEQVASQGRGDDSLLVHMTPDEVRNLQQFAQANGTTLTINPTTGLPEAGLLSDLFKSIAPIALGAFLGPAGLGMSSMMAGVATGGITTLATGSLSRGLMAGLGAYGGAGLGESLMTAGGNAMVAGGAPVGAENLVGGVSSSGATAGSAVSVPPIEQINPSNFNLAKPDVLSAGAKAAMDNPMAFAKNNLGNLAYAAAPIAAGMMVPTTTKLGDPKDTGYIRQFDYNINPDTGKPDPLYGMRAMTPVKASEFKDKTFQGQRDLFRQQNPNPYDIGIGSLNQPPQQQQQPTPMAGGGIVALAGGGVPGYAIGGAPGGGITGGVGLDMNNDIYKYFADPATQALLAAGNDAAVAQVLQDRNYSLADVAKATGTQNQLADYETRFVNAINPTTLNSADFLAQTADVGLRNQALTTAMQGAGMSAAAQYAATHKLDDTAGIASAPTAAQDFYNAYGYKAGDAPGDKGGIAGLYTNIDYAADRLQDQINAGKLTVQQAQNLSLAEMERLGINQADIKGATGKNFADLFKAKPIVKDTITGGTGNDTLKGGTGNDVITGTGVTTVTPTPFTSVIPGGFYGNATNPGDITTNPDGTVTVHPNIPYRPPGGFSGIGEVSDAYTKGGGSLGYTAKAPKTAAEHNAMYNKLTDDSLDAYNFLMGKGKNLTQRKAETRDRPVMQRYDEAVLGRKAAKLTKPGTTTTKTVTGTPGQPQTYFNEAEYLAANPDVAAEIKTGKSVSGQPTQFTSGYEHYLMYGKAGGRAFTGDYEGYLTAAALANAANAGGGGPGNTTAPGLDADSTSPANSPPGDTVAKEGGIIGYAMGGGLGSLGSYSDGGRLLRGPGDGVSDSIPATIGRKQQPARLADGEFVIPARIVSELGNGSTDAGAKKLYAMMDRVQKARGKTTGKNKVAANSRSDKYLPA